MSPKAGVKSEAIAIVGYAKETILTLVAPAGRVVGTAVKRLKKKQP